MYFYYISMQRAMYIYRKLEENIFGYFVPKCYFSANFISVYYVFTTECIMHLGRTLLQFFFSLAIGKNCNFLLFLFFSHSENNWILMYCDFSSFFFVVARNSCHWHYYKGLLRDTNTRGASLTIIIYINKLQCLLPNFITVLCLNARLIWKAVGVFYFVPC